MPRNIYIVNKSKHVTAADLTNALASLQIQVDRDFHPWWAASCQLLTETTVSKGQEVIYLQDSLSVADALGYHDLTGPDTPVGFVDVALTLQAGDHWQATLSHELLEQLVDPFVQGGYTGTWQGQTALLAAETADPVENDEYQINGIWVSNFITPYWFVQGPLDAGKQTDFMGTLKGQPLTLRPGGYVAYTNDLVNWQQSFGKAARLHQMEYAPWSRRGRRQDRLRATKKGA